MPTTVTALQPNAGTQGDAATTTNTGASLVTVGTGNTAVLDTGSRVFGRFGVKCSIAANGATASLRAVAAANSKNIAASYLVATPAVRPTDTTPVVFAHLRSTAGVAAKLIYTPAGNVLFRDASNHDTTLITNAPVDTMYWYEVQGFSDTSTTGTATLQVYRLSDLVQVYNGAQLTGQNLTSGSLNGAELGIIGTFKDANSVRVGGVWLRDAGTAPLGDHSVHNNFAGIQSGTALTTSAQTQQADGTALTLDLPTGVTLTADATHPAIGQMGARLDIPADTYGTVGLPLTTASGAFRHDRYVDTIPADGDTYRMLQLNTAAGQVFRVYLQSNGHIRIDNASGTVLGSSPKAVLPGSFLTIAGWYTQGASNTTGTLHVIVYRNFNPVDQVIGQVDLDGNTDAGTSAPTMLVAGRALAIGDASTEWLGGLAVYPGQTTTPGLAPATNVPTDAVFTAPPGDAAFDLIGGAITTVTEVSSGVADAPFTMSQANTASATAVPASTDTGTQGSTTAVAAAVATGEAGTMSESSGVFAVQSASDTATNTSAAVLGGPGGVTLGVSDQATGAEVAAAVVSAAAADTGTASDASAITTGTAVARSDTATAADSAGLAALVPTSDAAAAVDTSVVARALSAVDDATSYDDSLIRSLISTRTSDDTATSSEASAPDASGVADDLGVLDEQVVIVHQYDGEEPILDVIDLAALRVWLEIKGHVNDDELRELVLAEAELQTDACRVPAYTTETTSAFPRALKRALYRRVGRELSARGVPLGLAGQDSENGPVRMPAFDPEIERLEAPWRKMVFA